MQPSILIDRDENFVHSRPIARVLLRVIYDSLWPLKKLSQFSETIVEHTTLRIAKWDFFVYKDHRTRKQTFRSYKYSYKAGVAGLDTGKRPSQKIFTVTIQWIGGNESYAHGSLIEIV